MHACAHKVYLIEGLLRIFSVVMFERMSENVCHFKKLVCFLELSSTAQLANFGELAPHGSVYRCLIRFLWKNAPAFAPPAAAASIVLLVLFGSMSVFTCCSTATSTK